MSSFEVRPFRRSDREQLTTLVTAHAGAVTPGMSASASTVLSAMKRQPGEFIEDPWVSDRMTLVAVPGDRIAAAAHLLRLANLRSLCALAWPFLRETPPPMYPHR